MTVIPEALVRQFTEELVPFNHWLGLKVRRFDPGEVDLLLPFRAELVGDPLRPALHGGVLSALIDATGGACVFSRLGPYDRISTVDLRVDFLRPARPEDLICHAKVVRIGNRVAAVSATVFHDGESEEPVAMGMCVFNIRRGHPDESPP